MTHASLRPRNAATALLLLVVCLGCSDRRSPPTIPEQEDPSGGVVYHSACLLHGGLAAVADSFRQDCVAWQYNGADTLLLKHLAAPFNCCPDSLFANVTVRGDTIWIEEEESLDQGGCNCLCVYELHVQIVDLPARSYQIRLQEKYLHESEEALNFRVDLAATPIGTHCENRHGYPWQVP
jgi:hypothetical protein